MSKANYYFFDLPDDFQPGKTIAIDTEAMGLFPGRDRLCVVQLADAQGNISVVHFPQAKYDNSSNLVRLLSDFSVQKIMHFARFDVAIMQYYFQIAISNIVCTKIASRLARTYTDCHGLKELCSELLQVKLCKQQQSSDWGAATLTTQQLEYAASDVKYLHAIWDKLEKMLKREGRWQLATSCFEFVSTRAQLDVSGWPEQDIFAH